MTGIARRALCLGIALSASASILLSANSARAQAPRPCSELPDIAWQNIGTINLSVVGLVGVKLRQNPFVKDLYLQALCGVYPQRIWDLVDSGQGAVLEIPSIPESNLAAALHKVTPHLALTRYVYVRGGGPDREILVVLLTDGYQGPWFDVPDRVTPPNSSEVDNRAPWTAQATARLERQWNLLPYRFLRRAARRIHDYGRYLRCHQAKLRLRLAFGLIKIDIPFFEEMCDRGVANPFGTMLLAATREQPLSNAQVHETGHFVQFESSGHMGQLYLDGLTSISFENQRVLGIKVPHLFRKRHEEAKIACDEGSCQPFGFVSNYAACGSSPAEDFADTIMVAMGMTHGIWKNIHLPDHVPERIPSNYDNNAESFPHSDCYPSDSMHRLYSRTDDPDADILAAKAAYMYETFSLSPTLPMDADGDGLTWTVGQTRGESDSDCDDTNPVLGGCESGSCASILDCVDEDFCTVESCHEGWCFWPLVDEDNDGYSAATCGGDDCDDQLALVNPSQTEVCNDGLDNDCAGGPDDPGAVDARSWYEDADGDGYGAGSASLSCQAPGGGWVHLSGDCDDTDSATHPGAAEVCGSPCRPKLRRQHVRHGRGWRRGRPRATTATTTALHRTLEPSKSATGRDNNCNSSVDEGVSSVSAASATPTSTASAPPATSSAGAAVAFTAWPVCFREPYRRPAIISTTTATASSTTECARASTETQTATAMATPDDSTWACKAPAGYVSNSDDCYDRNSDAHPGQYDWFSSDRGDGSYDYDCDGQQHMADVNIAWCKVYIDHGEGGYGWKDNAAHCGQLGDYTVVNSGCGGGAAAASSTSRGARAADNR